ncbi:unnamed protein product [Rotaria magnacalcarata]|nr:unnamed protein product [Rotaria magnacalcarata]CAF4121285.1 unnamed protein product [Rotaria magnacalcarata]
MNRYRHFDNEFDSNNTNSPAILPEIEVDEPFQLEFSPHLQPYPSNYDNLKIFFLHRTALERFLFYLIILLLIILFVIIIICLSYSKEKEKSYNTICLTPSCIEVSYSIASGINQSVDPCEDFHQFVCGNWIRKNIIPKGHSTWSIPNELGKKNMIILKNILEQTSSSVDAEQQAIKYYQSCMNLIELERLQIQTLEIFFQNTLNFTLKQWINLDKNQTWQQTFIYLLKLFSNQYGFLSIFPIRIDSDEKNSTWNNIYIDQPELILGTRDYYIQSTTNNQSNERNRIIRETLSKVGSEILQLLGFEKNDSLKRMNDIIQFETELALVNLPMEALQKPNETYHLMPLKQLQEYYQSIGLDIYAYFNDILNTNSIKLNGNDQVIVLSFELVFNISNILTNYLLASTKSYVVIDHLLFSFVFNKILHLSSSFEKAMIPLKKALYGVDSSVERWDYCIRKTDDAFGFALSALYLRTTFDEDDRLKANELVENIRLSFEENLDKLQWIDGPTKKEAKKKLKKINQKIGYPDFIKNQTYLNERYGGYTIIENEYFNNEIKVSMREQRRTILKYRKKVDASEWRMTPLMVNAYYSPPANEIVFPAGILQPPFFHKDLPLAINYGAIGSVIGHEITHGFDNQGREFDADGNMISWWTNSALNNFEEKTKCFIQQYSNFTIDGQNINGQRTLG